MYSVMANSTPSYELPPLPTYTLKPLSPLIPGIPDQYLALALPIVAYWATSMLFHMFDELDLFPQYRLHTPAEVVKRNHVSRLDVFRDVVVQQVVQTVVGFGLTIVEPAPSYGKEAYDVARWAQRIRQMQFAIPTVLAAVGLDASRMAVQLGTSHTTIASVLSGGVYPELTQTILLAGEPTTAPAFADWEILAAKAVYHALVPAFQFLLGVCIVDTWQYFLHRAMHMNKYLYTTFHSRHHRLYVPYAYGALYNHPFEGFLLDTLGAGIAYLVSRMTVRQSMWFFTCSTIKTVDDHCGYAFPWDPLQHLTSNNAGYHDVHHQSWGIKTNFSQPFFTFWDSLLGTKWTGGDVSARYQKAKMAAQKKLDAEHTTNSVSGSDASESLTARTAPYARESEAASSAARAAQSVAEPAIPAGKATQQAMGSREQIISDKSAGGVGVLAEESAEEAAARKSLRRNPGKRTASSGLKGLADRVGESLHGKATGVLGVESGRR